MSESKTSTGRGARSHHNDQNNADEAGSASRQSLNEAADSSRSKINWMRGRIEGFWFWVFHTLRIPNPIEGSAGKAEKNGTAGAATLPSAAPAVPRRCPKSSQMMRTRLLKEDNGIEAGGLSKMLQ